MKKTKQWAIKKLKRNFFEEGVLAEMKQLRLRQLSESIKRGLASKKLSTRQFGM